MSYQPQKQDHEMIVGDRVIPGRPKDDPRKWTSVVLLGLALGVGLLGLIAYTGGGKRALPGTTDCASEQVKICSTNEDCGLARSGPCSYEAFSTRYVDACNKRLVRSCDHTDWDNVHAVCSNQRCTVAPGF